MCSLQDLKSPIKRFSSPKIPETYHLSSVDETVGDTVALDEQKSQHSKEEKVATTCSLNVDGNDDTTLPSNQTKMVHQEKQCTVEIHANPFTDDAI